MHTTYKVKKNTDIISALATKKPFGLSCPFGSYKLGLFREDSIQQNSMVVLRHK